MTSKGEGTQKGAGEAPVGGRSFAGAVWAFLSSVKFTIFVLMLIAFVSIFGTVIEQGDRDASYYAMKYGKQWGALIIKLNLQDMYHSYWFTAILGLLVVNILVCTYDRFPSKWKALAAEGEGPINTGVIDKLTLNETVNFGAEAAAAKDRIIALLGEKKYKTRVEDSDGGAYAIYAWKGKLGRFGADFTHLSLLVILTGAIVGGIWGHKDFKAIYLGATADAPGGKFQVRLDKFWIEYYDTGQIRQYNSLLTVIDGGKEVMQKQIWVNEPLYYKGVRFYQSSYGSAWDRLDKVQVSLRTKGDNPKIFEAATMDWNETVKLPGGQFSVKPLAYVADFAYDTEQNVIYSKTGEDKNPGIQLEVFDALGKRISRPWLLYNYPQGVMDGIPGTNYDLVFAGYKKLPYSGISVNEDPGTNIVWVGCSIMGLGFVLAFFVYHRRLWIKVEPGGGGKGSANVRIGGMTNKNQLGFESEFASIAASIRGQGAETEEKNG